jgi:hypothetical protein
MFAHSVDIIRGKVVELLDKMDLTKKSLIIIIQLLSFYVIPFLIIKYQEKFIVNILFVILSFDMFVFVFIILHTIIGFFRKKEEPQLTGEGINLKAKFEKIVDEDVTAKEIIEIYKDLERASVEKHITALNEFKTKDLNKIKFILEKDKKQRAVKIPWSVIIPTFITTFIGILKLAENEIDKIKEVLTIILGGAILFIITLCYEYYTRAYKEKIPIDSDYLILQIDSIVEQKKDKEKKNETKAVVENNDTIETETIEVIKVLEINEREGVLKIKIENKKAPVNNTSAEK